MGALASKVSYFHRAARFIAHKHVHGYEVRPEPTFDLEGLAFFRSAIRDTSVYLEYGSGGSTVLAAQFVDTLVSVESDPVFRDAVKRALPVSNAEIHLLSPNIGPVREWGTPVFGRPTKSRIKRWKRYPAAPWPILAGRRPELILIDGRFRIACALESLLHVNRETRLLVDDYVGRDYSEIARFADLVCFHGRMAEFRKKMNFSEQDCTHALAFAYSNHQ